jgi:hypothetical protein
MTRRERNERRRRREGAAAGAICAAIRALEAEGRPLLPEGMKLVVETRDAGPWRAALRRHRSRNRGGQTKTTLRLYVQPEWLRAVHARGVALAGPALPWSGPGLVLGLRPTGHVFEGVGAVYSGWSVGVGGVWHQRGGPLAERACYFAEVAGLLRAGPDAAAAAANAMRAWEEAILGK